MSDMNEHLITMKHKGINKVFKGEHTKATVEGPIQHKETIK